MTYEGDHLGSLDRHGLDHDRASLMGGARSDVTMGLWKSLRAGERYDQATLVAPGRLRPDTAGPLDPSASLRTGSRGRLSPHEPGGLKIWL
jgi:hypothetical protein